MYGIFLIAKVTDHGFLLMELDSGLSFPATEHLSQVIYDHALRGKMEDIFA